MLTGGLQHNGLHKLPGRYFAAQDFQICLAVQFLILEAGGIIAQQGPVFPQYG